MRDVQDPWMGEKPCRNRRNLPEEGGKLKRFSLICESSSDVTVLDRLGSKGSSVETSCSGLLGLAHL